MEQNILKIDNEDIPLVNCFSLKKNAGGYFKCTTTYHRMIWVIFNYEKIKNREIIWNLDDTILPSLTELYIIKNRLGCLDKPLN